jgi:hypothetical protein
MNALSGRLPFAVETVVTLQVAKRLPRDLPLSGYRMAKNRILMQQPSA